MDIRLHIFPKTFTLIGIEYKKLNMLVEDHVKTCHQLSIGILFIILEFMIYEKGSE